MGRRAIPLVKAHAYGNDFLLVSIDDLVGAPVDLARQVCDRHRGIGADGLILLSPSRYNMRMDLLNADGSHSEISGNGVRCVAALLATYRYRKRRVGSTVVIDTDAGPKTLELLSRDGKRLTFVAEMGPPTELREVDLVVGDVAVRVVVMRVGNPQCVVLGPATPDRLNSIGRALATHEFFPQGTNVELAEVVDPGEVRILIWERGVGPTESSGTGSCAAAVAAAAYGGANRAVDVVSPGGSQRVEWTSDGLQLTGWAEVIGEIDWWVA